MTGDPRSLVSRRWDSDLAEWLGVSRTPVREALLRLGASGLVVAARGRFTTVSAIDERAVREARISAPWCVVPSASASR